MINGESWGIYANSQEYNADLTQEAFHSRKGARWKVPGNPGAPGGLACIGDNAEAYKPHYEIRTKDDPKSWNDLIHLCKVLSETPAANLEQALNGLLDLDEALKFLALDKAAINNDGYWVRMSATASMKTRRAGSKRYRTIRMRHCGRPRVALAEAGAGRQSGSIRLPGPKTRARLC